MSGIEEVVAVVGIASAVAGTAVSVAGAEQSASAQSQAAAYQAQVAANNQQMAATKASQAAQTGEAQAAQVAQKTRSVAGAITAAQAANNIDVNTGSAVDVKTGAAETGQLDALTIRSNAARAAYGFQTEGLNYSAEAGLLEQKSAQAVTAGNIGAAGSLLGGASSTATDYARLNQAGAFGRPSYTPNTTATNYSAFGASQVGPGGSTLF